MRALPARMMRHEIEQQCGSKWPEELLDTITHALDAGIITATRYDHLPGGGVIVEVFRDRGWVFAGQWDRDPGAEAIDLAVGTLFARGDQRVPLFRHEEDA
jgi:hypothetical protein